MFIHQYLFETPIDIDRTRLYLLNMRNFLIDPEDDARMMERNAIVANQDRDVLSNLRPVVTPNTNLHVGDAESRLAVQRDAPVILKRAAHRVVRYRTVIWQFVWERSHITRTLHIVLAPQRIYPDTDAADIAGRHDVPLLLELYVEAHCPLCSHQGLGGSGHSTSQ